MTAPLKSSFRNVVSKSFTALCMTLAWPQISAAQNASMTLVTQQVLPAGQGDRVFYHQSRDWFVKCDYQAEADISQCELATLMVPQEKGQGLAFGLTIVMSCRDTPPVAIVRTPLNLLLSSGVAMKVDQRPVGKLAYRSCNQGGCIVPFSLQGSVLAALMKGANVEFEFSDLSESTQTARFSLLGIAKALSLATDFN
jgi:invasion protein IalB